VSGAVTLTTAPENHAGGVVAQRDVAPPERLAMVRILVSAYAVVWLAFALPGIAGLTDAGTSRWHPVGVLAWLDTPLAPGWLWVFVAVTFGAGIAFAVGAGARVTGPLFAAAFLVVTTYRSCWGQIFHTDDLVALHLIVLALAPAAHAWSVDARRRAPAPPPARRYGWPLLLMSIITVLTYVLAGWAKLRTSGLDWITGSVLRDQIAQDNLLKELFGAPSSPLASAVLSHAWLFPPMAAFAVLVELGAPVALLGGRWRDVWVGAAWLFHLGILVLMTTFFPYQLSGIAYASMFRVERLPRTLVAPFRR
jgi:Vitamin K-dependent gamma-carboxylase